MPTSSFHNMGSDEGAETLLDVLGEPVTYKPLNGNPRKIVGAVDRDQPTTPVPSGPRARPKASIRVTVRNARAGGIDLAELNLGGDKLALPVRAGQAVTDRPIKALLSQAFGMLELEVG